MLPTMHKIAVSLVQPSRYQNVLFMHMRGVVFWNESLRHVADSIALPVNAE